MKATINGRPVHEVLKEECQKRGHVPVPVKDCDDWPSLGCVCNLVGTAARVCARCHIRLDDSKAKPPSRGGEEIE